MYGTEGDHDKKSKSEEDKCCIFCQKLYKDARVDDTLWKEIIDSNDRSAISKEWVRGKVGYADNCLRLLLRLPELSALSPPDIWDSGRRGWGESPGVANLLLKQPALDEFSRLPNQNPHGTAVCGAQLTATSRRHQAATLSWGRVPYFCEHCWTAPARGKCAFFPRFLGLSPKRLGRATRRCG